MTTATNPNTNSNAPLATEIWSPSSAANLSLVFTPLFGAYLHHRNWLALGEQERAATAKKWIYAGVALLVLTTLGAWADKNLSGLWLIFLFAWYFASARAQIKHVQVLCGESYARKSMVKPIFVALGCLVAFVALFVVAGNMANGTTSAVQSEESSPMESSSPEGNATEATNIAVIPFEDFYVDFDVYVNQEAAIEGLLLTMGDLAYLYKDEGSTVAVQVDLSGLTREEKKIILTECGEGCKAKMAVHAISGSNPKAVQALRLLP